MILAYIYLDNIYGFKDFSASFVYPKKIVNNPLGQEYLKNYPNFRYKKVNIIFGSNATGKTTLGKAIWNICLFLNRKEGNRVSDIVCDKTKTAHIVFDYVLYDGVLIRADILIEPINSENTQNIKVKILKQKLLKTDSYETAVTRFNTEEEYKDYREALSDLVFNGWSFNFPLTEQSFDKVMCPYEGDERKEFTEVLLAVIKTMDPSIKEINLLDELPKSYVVVPENGDSFAVNHFDKISSIERLSSGTKYGFNIAATLFNIMKHKNGFYYVDEQFSYCNSEIEIAILNLMSNFIGDGEQLFFTSHNGELLSLNYPIHAFNFLRKVKEGNTSKIEMINASSLEKRNNVNIKNLYDNDYFVAGPNLEELYKLGEKN